MKKLLNIIASGSLMAGLLVSTTIASSDSLLSKTTVSGFGYIMSGEIVHGEVGNVYNNDISNYWQNHTLVHLGATSIPNKWFTTNLALEVQMLYPLKAASTEAWQSFYPQYKLTIPVAEGIFHWDFKNPLISSLKIEAGAFPYTFNDEVKDLGNYLYRSQAHPMYTQTKLDYPWADLFGARAEAGFLQNTLKMDAFFTSEQNFIPWFDWSPGVTIDYSPDKIIDVGIGATFPHLAPAFCGWLPDSIGKKWRATILDAKAIFDPKPLIGDLGGIFGNEDCKIYGEAGVLGLKDSNEYGYTGFKLDTSTTLMHRIPLLLGINVPTFKLLDYLSVELEWWKSPYPNEWLGDYQNQNAAIVVPSDSAQVYNYIALDNFKWAISAKKAIGNFEIRALVGDDHTIFPIYLVEKEYTEQTLKRLGDWQWFIELRYNL